MSAAFKLPKLIMNTPTIQDAERLDTLYSALLSHCRDVVDNQKLEELDLKIAN